MVGVVKRMNVLRSKILNIRLGPGAAVLPQDVTRIHMEFAKNIEEGHMGPRKFFKENLPRLKFWNPSVPMIVNRTENQHGSSTLSLYFREGGTGATEFTMPSSSTKGHAKAPEPVEGERVVTIDMKNRRSEMILKDFMDKTGAVPVAPTPQEEAELKDLAELHKRSEIDREIGRKLQEARRREAAMLAQARTEAAALKAGD
ncbi:CI-B8 domain-containing protein [Podospora appendiculata]|uniref:CI-B8 domain-containing protein n=1 Tax=Podospora appendiculata TaxID=314037 RepID=A0AAE0X2P8_9PEZI|nr:CI-B8 domain-containing protein [Podospora appendiculata]